MEQYMCELYLRLRNFTRRYIRIFPTAMHVCSSHGYIFALSRSLGLWRQIFVALCDRVIKDFAIWVNFWGVWNQNKASPNVRTPGSTNIRIYSLYTYGKHFIFIAFKLIKWFMCAPEMCRMTTISIQILCGKIDRNVGWRLVHRKVE